MKKLLLLVALVSCLVAKAETLPETFYLCGTMNGWITPADGGTQFVLTDTDGDGVYTGTFEIPGGCYDEYLEFKIFNKIADWTDPENHYGTDFSIESLFNANKLIYPVGSEMSGNISIDNWKGGILEVKFDYKAMRVELTSSTQPDMPSCPDVYLIGAFNDMAVPDSASDNGAIKLPLNSTTNAFNFFTTVELPEGDPELKFVVIDAETRDLSYWGHNSPAVTLYTLSGNPCPYYASLEKSNSVSVQPLQIANWKGGKMSLQFTLYLNMRTAISILHGEDQPQFPFGNTIYGIYDTGDGDREIISLPITSDEYYSNYVWAVGSSPSIIFTTENSLNPDPENCWGIAATLADGVETGSYAIVKGGSPISVAFRENGRLTVSANWMQGIMWIETYDMSIPPSPEEIYLIGSPQGWSISDGSMPLPRTEITPDGWSVYTQVFEIDESEPILRFYTQLGDWENGSIGSQVEDTPINITVTDVNTVYDAVYGKGSWRLIDWQPGNLKVKVTLRGDLTPYVEFARYEEEAVNEVEFNDSESVYYNLQGVKLDRPVPGLLIKVTDGKSSKVIVR